MSCILGACIVAIGMHTVSRHSPSGDYQNANPGLYVMADNGLIFGGYRNSFGRLTYYAGWTTPEWHRLSLTLAAGTGYRPDEVPALSNGLSVLAAPTIRLVTIGQASLKMVWLPRVEKSQVEVLHWTVEWKLK